MIYNDFQNEKISALSLGCMRLPVKDNDDKNIDEERTAEMVRIALEKGINYFDTAWGYHGGQSEIVMGKVLNRYPRDSYYFATKFPGYDTSNMEKCREIFVRQLEKCGMEYFDFYLCHNVCESNVDMYLDPKYGILDFLLEQKKAGKIRHLGFSAHGNLETMTRFLDVYGDAMEFCQIQLNYLDRTLQKADEKVELLNSRGIPIWVMEPVRGGKLAGLYEKHDKMLKALRPEETAAGWAFRYLQSVPGIVTVLSGMSDEKQLRENIATYEEYKPLTKQEEEVLFGIADDMISKKIVPCTACRYCTAYCPQELDIPYLISLYNEHKFSDGGFIAPMALSALEEDKKPSACLECKSCEAVCPQKIKISEVLKDFCGIL